MELNKFTFRLDVEWRENKQPNEAVFLSQLKDFIKSNFPQYAIFFEISRKTKKPHAQGVLHSTKKREATAKMFKTIWPSRFVKPFYSLVEVDDEDKYSSYICKDGIQFVNNLFFQEQINEFNEKFKNVEYREKALTFTQKVFKDFINEYTTDCNTLRHLSYYNYKLTEQEKDMLKQSKDVLIGYILKRLGNLCKVFDCHTLTKIYNGILNAILQDDISAQKRNLEYWSNRMET